MTGKLSDIITSSSKDERQAISGIRIHFRNWFVVANGTNKWTYAVEAIEVTFKDRDELTKRENRKSKTEKQSMTMVKR